MQISVGSRTLATGYRAVTASDRRVTAAADCGDVHPNRPRGTRCTPCYTASSTRVLAAEKGAAQALDERQKIAQQCVYHPLLHTTHHAPNTGEAWTCRNGSHIDWSPRVPPW